MADPVVPIEQTADQRANAYRDAGVTPPTGSTTPPIARTITPPTSTTPSTGADAAQSFLDNQQFKTPQSEDDIANAKIQAAKGQIDAINANYDSQVAEKQKVGADRLSQDNATSVLSGLMGGTEAGASRTKVLDANSKEIQAVNAQRGLELQNVYTKISQDAHDEARQQVLDATKSAEDVVKRRADSQAKALDSIKQMAAGGLVDFEQFKNSPQNKAVYDYALQAAGGSEDQLRAIFAINRPQDQIVGTPTRVGDHFVQAYKNPITGAVRMENIPIPGGIGAEYKTFQKMGDNLVAIPDGWDGDVTKLKTIAGTQSAADKLDLQYKQAQIDNIRSEIGSRDKKPGSGSTSDGIKFTQTQINKGSASAGVNGTDFKALDPTVQNFYINGGATLTGAKKEIDSVRAGTKSADDVKAMIDSSNQPDAVKAHLKSLIDNAAPKNGGNGFLHSLGGMFKSAYDTVVN